MHKHAVVRTAVPFAVLICALFGTLASAQQVDSFTLDTVSGSRYTFAADGNASAYVITFFTTFCKPCAQEHPHLEQLYQEYREQGLHVLAISADEPGNLSKVRLWVRRYRLTFPVLLDSNSEVTRRYNPDLTFPLTMVLDRNCAVRSVFQGYTPGDEANIEREVKALLGLE
jgi:cytochrome c biogenesis protein CcmG, thiol:disulfide interchange protein DsbE